jgi:hypothetical protein
MSIKAYLKQCVKFVPKDALYPGIFKQNRFYQQLKYEFLSP